MVTTLTIANESVNIDNTLRAKSGGIIKISEFAKMKGLQVNKETRKQFALAKRDFFKSNRRALALAAADDSFDVTKVQAVYSTARENKPSEFQGFNFAVRCAVESAPAGPSEAEIIEQAAARLATKLGCTVEEAREMFK